MMAKVIFLVLAAEFINVVGQILFKKSTNTFYAGKSLRGVKGHFSYIKNILSRREMWGGLIAQILSLIVWVFALAQADLSFVFPLGSIQYVLILLGAHIFLGERIDKMKFVGTFLVMTGIILITMSR